MGLFPAAAGSGKPKVKLYRTTEGFLKGDGWVSFLRPESVELALQLADGAEYRPGYQLSVKPVRAWVQPSAEGRDSALTGTEAPTPLPQQAEFEEKGEKKKKKVDKKKIKQGMLKLNKYVQRV